MAALLRRFNIELIATTCREARRLGLKHYFSGKPCPKGHLSHRYTSTQSCIQCATEKQKDYIQSRGGYRKRRFIPDDELYQEAKNYKTRSEFQKNRISHYSAAHKRGILDDVCSHMLHPATKKKWFLCTLIKEVSKYETLSDFTKLSSGAASFALDSGLYPLVRNRLNKGLSGDYDVLYLMSFHKWKDGKQLYKLGVTSFRLGDQRIRQNQRSSPYKGSVVLMLKTRRAVKIESELLSDFERYNFNQEFSGSTEYFLASDEELTKIYERILRDE